MPEESIGMRILSLLVITNLFTGVLCLALAFVRRFFLCYGTVELDVNDTKHFSIEGGSTLLSAMHANDIFIPAACGGKGTCGLCRVSTARDCGAPLSPQEMVLLKSSDIRAGVRLACQMKLRRNASVMIPEEWLEIKAYEATLIGVEQVTPRLKKMLFTLKDELLFLPGQYIQIEMDSGSEKIIRAYSLASAPTERRLIELDVLLVEDGAMTPRLHSLQTGHVITFSGPYGDMCLREDDSTRPVICVAGGVGLAPMKSMLLHLVHTGYRRRFKLYYGARTLNELYDHTLLLEYAQRYDWFDYFPTLSGEAAKMKWDGLYGTVPQVLERFFPNDCLNGVFFICGPVPMIEPVTRILLAHGVGRENIMTDVLEI